MIAQVHSIMLPFKLRQSNPRQKELAVLILSWLQLVYSQENAYEGDQYQYFEEVSTPPSPQYYDSTYYPPGYEVLGDSQYDPNNGFDQKYYSGYDYGYANSYQYNDDQYKTDYDYNYGYYSAGYAAPDVEQQQYTDGQNTSPPPPWSPSSSYSYYGAYDKYGNYFSGYLGVSDAPFEPSASPPSLVSTPPSPLPSIASAYSSLLDILNLAGIVTNPGINIASLSDIQRLQLDSEGYWGNDVIEGWQGNIQFQEQESDSVFVYEEKAYANGDDNIVTDTGLLDFENVCTDHNPFRMVRTCREMADDGKCWESELVNDHVCDKTCGRAPCQNVCDDLLPQDFMGVYQCWELVSECDNNFMIDNNYCAATCGRAPCNNK